MKFYQEQISILFDTERSVVTKHLRNIFQTGELDKKSKVQKMHIALSDKPVALYRLDAIISVGYRINSKRGTQFRIWATRVLHEHIIKGYTVNESRLKELNQAIRLIACFAGKISCLFCGEGIFKFLDCREAVDVGVREEERTGVLVHI